MRMSSPDEMRQSVQRLKAYLEFTRPFAHLQLCTMEKHEQLACGVYRVTYSEGWQVLVNYTDCDYLQGNAAVGANSAVLLHEPV